ncbi:helix-turn-helix transcriptional regulator [Erwinia aphidicola]|uniref:helix-turn-helix transcriptional regulator n=1 Tax=Erwinia aphidicola TaxID=68334 RepID=UPI0030D425D7
MKSISDVRRENLISIIDRDYQGNQSLAARAIGVRSNLVSRWCGEKGIGAKSARRIEEATVRPKYWLDTDHSTQETFYPDETLMHEAGIVAAANLAKWMKASRTLNTQARLSEKSGVSQATINRLLTGEAGISIKNLSLITTAFGRQTYEMLIPDNDNRNIPYDRVAYAALPQSEKDSILSFIEFVIKQNQGK